MSQTVYGIDLGTTYSAISIINEFGTADVIENMEGDNTTPSVVYFEDESNFVVGKEAKNSQKVYPDDTISLVKRLMGEKRELSFQGTTHTPESISALILRQLVEEANEQLEEDVNDVVITVPAYFGLVEKEATRTAGEIAGLNVKGIIAEPVAAAISAGFKPGASETVFVYDLGGGTFDCTVMTLSDEGIEVVAVDGDRYLGGADWDEKLFDYVLTTFVEKAGLDEDPADDDQFYQEILSEVESAKKSLTKKRSAKVRCSFGSITEMIEVTREKFEEITKPLVDQTLEIAERTLEAATAKKPNLNVTKYLLVGGSSRMPMISDALEKKFGWELTVTEFDLAVAKGAAMYGQGQADFKMLNPEANAGEDKADEPRFYLGGVDSGQGMQINNILSKAVGVLFVDPETRTPHIGHLLNQGETLPAEASITAATLGEGATEISIHLYEQAGEVPSTDVDANKEITPETGATFTNLPQLPQGSPIELYMHVDSEGLLTFKGFEPQSNQELKLKVKVAAMQEDEIQLAKQVVGGLQRSE